MISNEFDQLWNYASRNGAFQQEKTELYHVYKLAKSCKTYLEVGTAEGGSLAILGHGKLKVAYIDWDEEHTRKPRQEVIDKLGNVIALHGSTHDQSIIDQARKLAPFDCVLIDAGHEYNDVVQDAIAYVPLATEYVFFHDMQIQAVRQAFEWYVNEHGYKKVHFFIDSQNYGYGIIEI